MNFVVVIFNLLDNGVDNISEIRKELGNAISLEKTNNIIQNREKFTKMIYFTDVAKDK